MGVIESRGALPWPQDEPRVHVDGPDPRRILLFGGAIAGGVGVASQQVALAGQLARALGTSSGRGVDVEVVSLPFATVGRLAKEMLRIRRNHFDAVVLVPGGRESLSLAPGSLWRRELGRLLAAVGVTAEGVPVVLVAVTQLPDTIRLEPRMRVAVTRTTDVLNAVSAELCAADPLRRFVGADLASMTRGNGAMEGYRAQARSIATALKPMLASRVADEAHRARPLAFSTGARLTAGFAS